MVAVDGRRGWPTVSAVGGDVTSWQRATGSDFERLRCGSHGKPPGDVLVAATRI